MLFRETIGVDPEEGIIGSTNSGAGKVTPPFVNTYGGCGGTAPTIISFGIRLRCLLDRRLGRPQRRWMSAPVSALADVLLACPCHRIRQLVLSWGTRNLTMAHITNSVEINPSWEATSCSANQHFSTFYQTRRFITVFTRAFQWSRSWARLISSIPPHRVYLR
jgi:hypothetical protein